MWTFLKGLIGLRAGLALAFALASAGGGRAAETAADAAEAGAGAAPLVVAANTILADLVASVGGDAVRVQSLARRGMDLHDFEPRPAEVRQLAGAALVVVNGLGLETWVTKLVAQSGYRGPVLTASAGVRALAAVPCEDTEDPAHAHAHPHAHLHGPLDPHAWHDLARTAEYVENIRAALTKLLPAEAEGFAARAAALRAEFAALDAWAREQVAAIPPERRKFVTSHDALRYLGVAYGLEVVPIGGVSPAREPSARELARLIDRIRAEAVPAIFVEAVTNRKLPELLAAEAGVKLGGELFTDSLGPADGPAGTFTGLFRTNIETITAALR